MASLAPPSNSLFANLPPPAECLAILVGFAEITIFGLAGLANPPSFAKGLGLPITNSSDDDNSAQLEAGTTTPQEATKAAKTQRGLILALAARNLEKGLTVMAFACYWRDRKALGTCIFAGLLTTAADYLAVKWYGEEEAAFGHVIGMVNCSLIGGALLYWSRDGSW